MVKDCEGFDYPQINEMSCIQCGLCSKICPANIERKETTEIQAFACYNLDDDIRKESSSGGFFSVLASYILEKKGCVYGAAFDSRNIVRHIRVDNKIDLYKLRGAKYIQSEIGTIYQQVLKDLKNDTYVLFSGTPCQVVGLRSFLGGDYDKLLTVDLICYGVPSPLIWELYKTSAELELNSKIKKISFREKNPSWRSYVISITTTEKKKFYIDRKKDPYMIAFQKRLSLRPSCYMCNFKGKNRFSDITLGDFWGIEVICPELFDDKGTSLVLTHTSKGTKYFNGICQFLKFKSITPEEALKNNPAFYFSATKNRKRNVFFAQVLNSSLLSSVKKYGKDAVWLILYRYFRQTIHNLRKKLK